MKLLLIIALVFCSCENSPSTPLQENPDDSLMNQRDSVLEMPIHPDDSLMYQRDSVIKIGVFDSMRHEIIKN